MEKVLMLLRSETSLHLTTQKSVSYYPYIPAILEGGENKPSKCWKSNLITFHLVICICKCLIGLYTEIKYMQLGQCGLFS